MRLSLRQRTLALIALVLAVVLLTQRPASIGDDTRHWVTAGGATAAPATRQTAPGAAAANDRPETQPAAPENEEPRGARCSKPARSFEPLGQFQFWGRSMNSSSPCPTSGMNNQLTLVHSLLHCAMRLGLPAFNWKDISCSPTGGRDGRRSYAVGSDDYEYAWFRWSEVLALPDPAPAPATAFCVSDRYTWSEHKAALQRCPSNIGGLIATPEYWASRRRLRLRPRFFALARCFLRFAAASAGSGGFEAALATPALRRSWDDCGGTSPGTSPGAGPGTAAGVASDAAVVGAHIRRGDYAGFCRGMMRSSGARKFRVPAFAWLRDGNATALSSGKGPNSVLHACVPSDDAVAGHLRRLAKMAQERAGGQGKQPVVVATNQASLLPKLRAALPDADVSSTSEWMQAAALTQPLRWPAALAPDAAKPRELTPTDRALLDIVVLALADVTVLNRYSTFSQTAVDLRVLHGHGPVRDLYWW